MNGIGAVIAIVLVVGWVIKGISAAVGNEQDDGKQRPKRSLEDWDDLQAKRLEGMSEQQQTLSEMRSDTSVQDPSQMTMAERIELARQRARQQAGLQDQGDQQAEALRQARARAEQQAKQQRELAQRQQIERQRAAQQQRAQTERAQQQRRRQAQAKAEQEAQAQAQRQRRTKQQRRAPGAGTSRAVTGSKRESVVAESMQRIHKGHAHDGPKVTRRKNSGEAGVGSLGLVDRNALRKAVIMKELLDKPVALRDTPGDLLS